MVSCPKCHTQVTDNSGLCPGCGEKILSGASDAAWIQDKLQKIKEANDRKILGFMTLTVGAFAAAIALVLYFLIARGSFILMIAALAGILICFIGVALSLKFERKARALLDQLEKAQPR